MKDTMKEYSAPVFQLVELDGANSKFYAASSLDCTPKTASTYQMVSTGGWF